MLKRFDSGKPAKSGGKSKEVEADLLPVGEYEGRLVYVADLGLQERSYAGDVKSPAQQIALGIEILGYPVKVDGEEAPRIMWTKPFVIFSRMNEKGNEYKYYKMFNPKAKPDTVADWEGVLGEPISVNVIHVKGRGDNADKTYNNIESLAPIPAKYHKEVSPHLSSTGIGDSEDENNFVNSQLYGLVKYVFDKRLNQPKKVDNNAKEEDDSPF